MPSERFILMQSWWLASTLVRRHPELTLIETHTGGGMYDCLSVLREQKTVIDINRVGSVHVHVAERPFRQVPVSELLEQEQAWPFLKELEESAGLGTGHQTPPSTPAVLTYRVIAELMAATVNDRHRWDVRNEYEDTSWYGGGRREFVMGFPIAAVRAEERRPHDLLGVPYYRYWGVQRDGEAVAVLDVDGFVYVGKQVFHLPEVYQSFSRRMLRTVAATLGTILP